MTNVTEPGVKGWCPGALRPMASGDGLIVRVRARAGAFALSEIRALAEAAIAHGNGYIDVTRRANLQLRGVTEASMLPLLDDLERLELLDASAEAEAVRNIMVAPLTGIDLAAADVRPVVHALAGVLASDTALQALPGKFGYVVDGGGALPITNEHADIVLAAAAADGAHYFLGLDGPDGPRWLGRVAGEHAAEAAAAAARTFAGCLGGRTRGRMRDATADTIAQIVTSVAPLLSPDRNGPQPDPRPVSRIGALALGDDRHVIGVGAPFGRLDAAQLCQTADLVELAGGRDIRLSPWRVLYTSVRDQNAAFEALHTASQVGLITNPHDPLLAVEACPGAPDCPSASLDTRGVGRRLAPELAQSGFTGILHVSGCWKGCARSAPAALTLIASGPRYLVVRDGTASSDPIASITPQEIAADPSGLLQLCREPAHA
jgi:precorrin-3B synthase